MQYKFIQKLYENYEFVYPFDNRKQLKPKNQRFCRFCGKTYPEVKFKKQAHFIPEFLGNKNLLNDFECDVCNQEFSVFENDFANYLGTFLTFAGIKGKSKIPKYKSNDRNIVVSQNPPFIDVTFKDKNYFGEHVGYDRDKKIQRIDYYSNPYTPLNVFKILLKIGLSVISTKDLEKLTDAFSFLKGTLTTNDLEKSNFFTINKYFIPGNIIIEPFLISYKKRQIFNKFPAPTFIFILHIRNLIIQFSIPFHDDDKFFFTDPKETKIYVAPPLIPETWFKAFGGPFREEIRLSSDQRRKGDKMRIEYQY
jgi:hypothetical protein